MIALWLFWVLSSNRCYSKLCDKRVKATRGGNLKMSKFETLDVFREFTIAPRISSELPPMPARAKKRRLR